MSDNSIRRQREVPTEVSGKVAPGSRTGRSAGQSRRGNVIAKMLQRYSHLWFVLPGFLFFSVFIIYPAVSAVALSFFDWRGIGKNVNFVGLANFREALASWSFYRAAFNNLVFFIVILSFQHTLGLLLAVQLNARPRFMQIYRTVLFMPVIISLVATGFIWTLMLSPHIGLINPVLRDLGLGFLTRAWLSDITWALPAVILVQAWNLLGWSIIIYLAGLQSIPEELRQAAQIDGANSWQCFWRVVFPLLSPSFTALTVLTFIQIFRVFDVVYVLTGPLGAPAGRTDVLGTLVYRTAFGIGGMTSADARMSYAVAMSVLIFIMMAIISSSLITFLRRRETQI
jgi:raffinose/stachyose/melibiose transport system permease protein